MPEVSEQDIYAVRIHERHEAYRARRMEVMLAADGIRPVGPDPRVPVHGGDQLVELLQQVNIDELLPVMDAIHTEGVAVVPLLNADEVAALRELLSGFFSQTAALFNRALKQQNQRHTVHIHNLLAKTRHLDKIACHPQMRAIVASVLGHDFLLNGGVFAMAPDPGCVAQGLHRDDSHYTGLPRPHLPLVLTVTIALDDFTAANGSTELVPGSGLWPEQQLPEPDQVEAFDVPAGSMLIWDGAILHGSGANSTDAARRSLTFNYTQGWLRTQQNHYLSVPRERVLQMPAALQKDLGYDVSTLGLGRCDRLHPIDYLNKLIDAGGDGEQSQLGLERTE